MVARSVLSGSCALLLTVVPLVTGLMVLGQPTNGVSQSSNQKVVQALPGYVYVFPRDHGTHDQFRIEWWYFTGHLFDEHHQHFGFELTFFRRKVEEAEVLSNPSQWTIRQLYFAHFALSDERTRRFQVAEKISRAGLGKAGAKADRLEVWIDGWNAGALTPDHGQLQLRASAEAFAIDLRLTAEKPPTIHGQEGVSRKGAAEGQASHYYSLTRLSIEGTLRVGEQQFPVTGFSWMDHEFGSGDLGVDQVGWDWFSLQLDSGMDLMVYQLRRADGTPDPASSGTVIFSDGRTQHVSLPEFHVEVLDEWESPASQAIYPSQWTLRIPSLALNLDIIPRMPNQELITRGSTQVTYWEGAVDVRGHIGQQPAEGLGFVEMTGYAKPLQKTY